MTINDQLKKSLHSCVSSVIDELVSDHDARNKDCIGAYQEYLQVVLDYIANHNEIAQALAHLRVSARLNVSYDEAKKIIPTDGDMMLLSHVVMECGMFSERQKLIIFNHIAESK